jgi:hypothetical protein
MRWTAAPRWIWLGALLLLVTADRPAIGLAVKTPRMSPAEQAFVRDHWQRPIPPQGDAPARFSPIERSLAPSSCGTCHPLQFQDWSGSIHSKSMGPGIAGQLVEMIKSDPASARSCFTCHAPLAEQAALVRGDEGIVPNPDVDPSLQVQGVVCASCHVRGHQRFGPPRRDGSVATRSPRETLPHNGLTRTSAFLRSEFCASCHQFAPNGLSLNGKLLENTYEEWRASAAARRGQQCQDCHMPYRRHLWRGIHDPEMVKSGVRITVRPSRSRYRPGDELSARIAVANTGVGHHFPTYVTPRVVVRAELLDRDGQPLPDTAEERAIGREVPLDLSREIADTRVPAGGRFEWTYRRPIDRPGVRLKVTVTVFPDHFYTEFFAVLLESGAGAGEGQIREALEATRRSPFKIFEREVPLT